MLLRTCNFPLMHTEVYGKFLEDSDLSKVCYRILGASLVFASWVVQVNIVTINRDRIVKNTDFGSFERSLGKINPMIRNSWVSEERWSKSGSCRDFKQQSQEGLVFKDLSLVLRYEPPCVGKDPIISVGIFSVGFVKGFRICPVYLDQKTILPLQGTLWMLQYLMYC